MFSVSMGGYLPRAVTIESSLISGYDLSYKSAHRVDAKVLV